MLNTLGRAQDRMHLDCVFSIVGDDVCIMMDEMMGESSPTRRLVDEWVRLHAGCPALCNVAAKVPRTQATTQGTGLASPALYAGLPGLGCQTCLLSCG